ncbi:fluoride efflux transporter CrcB [Methylophilaceae bacterium]|jgi:fluoride exporter|nr:fluoride efflux transporter CrcB [Methylophilaceae bacterium]|tara:strand:+ start:139 stop:528 length:390 start_codon:yes stop_codon:yes gene_type:complete
MFNLTNFLIIGVAAAIGAWIRWSISYILYLFYPGLPLGALAVNLLGGFLMGLSIAYFQTTVSIISEELKLFINIGFLGGLTTFSAYTSDIFSLLQKGEVQTSFLFLVSHVFGALIMAYLGWYVIISLAD